MSPLPVLPVLTCTLFDSSCFPTDKSLPIVEAILITLKAPYLAVPPSFKIRLLNTQHPPVASDAQDSGFDTTLGLQRDSLTRVQPVAVVPCLEVLREALAAELLVYGLQTGEDAGEKGLYVERRDVLWKQVRQRGCRTGIGSVDTDAEDNLVCAVEVAALGEDAADFDVGLGRCWFCRIEGI